METNTISHSNDLLIKFSNELNAIFENAAILLMLVNREGKVVNINRTGLELLNKDKSSVLGLLGGEVFSCINAWSNGEVVCGSGKNCNQCSVRNLVTDTFTNGTNHYKEEGSLEITREDKNIRLELLISTSKIDANNDSYILVTIDDITQLKKQELQLKELNNAKDTFISVLAHDLRSPFTTLLGFSELLNQNIKKYNIDKIEEQASYINDIALQTYNLLDDLLLWSKTQSNKITFNPKQVKLTELLKEVINNQKHIALKKNIDISISETTNTEVYADENMLKTVLRNLISNAIKFSNLSGSINLTIEKRTSDVLFIVSDNGIGMDKEQLSTIWQFIPGQKTLGTSGEAGTGFGLSICKEFIEKNGGTIWVESELGKGSDFKFTIPIIQS